MLFFSIVLCSCCWGTGTAPTFASRATIPLTVSTVPMWENIKGMTIFYELHCSFNTSNKISKISAAVTKDYATSRAGTLAPDYGAVIGHVVDPKKPPCNTPGGSTTMGDVKSGGDPQKQRPELLTLTPTDTQEDKRILTCFSKDKIV